MCQNSDTRVRIDGSDSPCYRTYGSDPTMDEHFRKNKSILLLIQQHIY